MARQKAKFMQWVVVVALGAFAAATIVNQFKACVAPLVA